MILQKIKEGFLHGIGIMLGILTIGLGVLFAYQFNTYSEVSEVGVGSGLTINSFNQLLANVRIHETKLNTITRINVDLNNTTEIFDKKCTYRAEYYNGVYNGTNAYIFISSWIANNGTVLYSAGTNEMRSINYNNKKVFCGTVAGCSVHTIYKLEKLCIN